MKAFISAFSILLIIITGCGYSTPLAISGPAIAYLYVVGQGSNNVTGFKQVADGEIAQLSLTFPSNPSPIAMTAHPSRNFVYVANSTSSTVSGFTFDHTTGNLAPVGTAITPSSVCAPSPAACSTSTPVSLSTDSAGHFLFVLNQGTAASSGAAAVSASISVFTIDTNRGLLNLVSGSPFMAPSLSAGQSQVMAVSPTAGFLYVANGADGSIAQMSFNSSGQLTDLGKVSGGTGADIAGLAIDSKGQFLYACDSVNNVILSFGVQSSGALSPVAAFPLAQATAETQPVALAIDATGKFLYSANESSGNVSAFTTSGGTLTEVSGSPYGAAGSGVVTAPQPTTLAVDITNGFLYVGNQGSRSVMAFSITAANGTLTAVPNTPFSQNVAPTALLSTR